MAKIPRDIVRRFFQEFGASGGRARAAALTPDQRRSIAQRAARARWAGHKKKKRP